MTLAQRVAGDSGSPIPLPFPFFQLNPNPQLSVHPARNTQECQNVHPAVVTRDYQYRYRDPTKKPSGKLYLEIVDYYTLVQTFLV